METTLPTHLPTLQVDPILPALLQLKLYAAYQCNVIPGLVLAGGGGKFCAEGEDELTE